MAALDVERIVRLQRNEHGAAAALVHEVEAVIEELAEQREPRVERRREAHIGRGVGQMNVVALHRDAEGLERGIAHAARCFQGRYGGGVGRGRGVPCVDGRLLFGVGGVAGLPSPSASAAALAFCMTTRAWYSASKPA